METLFSLDAQLLFNVALLAVSVFVLFTALSYLLFEPTRNRLEQRKEKIRQDLERASAGKEEARQLKVSYKKKLQLAEIEAEKIISSARKIAIEKQDKLLKEAKAEVENGKAQAQKELLLEREQAKDRIKKEIVRLAFAMAEKALAGTMDSKMQEMLLEETLQEIGVGTWEN